jgi:hypothetical protein
MGVGRKHTQKNKKKTKKTTKTLCLYGFQAVDQPEQQGVWLMYSSAPIVKLKHY